MKADKRDENKTPPSTCVDEHKRMTLTTVVSDLLDEVTLLMTKKM